MLTSSLLQVSISFRRTWGRLGRFFANSSLSNLELDVLLFSLCKGANFFPLISEAVSLMTGCFSLTACGITLTFFCLSLSEDFSFIVFVSFLLTGSGLMSTAFSPELFFLLPLDISRVPLVNPINRDQNEPISILSNSSV